MKLSGVLGTPPCSIPLLTARARASRRCAARLSSAIGNVPRAARQPHTRCRKTHRGTDQLAGGSSPAARCTSEANMTTSNRGPTFGSDCERFADALAAMDDEALEPRDRRRVDIHLAGCETCRELLADLQVIGSMAATLEPIEPPARVWHNVRRRIMPEEHAPRVPARWWSRWSFGGAEPSSRPLVAVVYQWDGPCRGGRHRTGDRPGSEPGPSAAAIGRTGRHRASDGGQRLGASRTRLHFGDPGSGAARRREGADPSGGANRSCRELGRGGTCDRRESFRG